MEPDERKQYEHDLNELEQRDFTDKQNEWKKKQDENERKYYERKNQLIKEGAVADMSVSIHFDALSQNHISIEDLIRDGIDKRVRLCDPPEVKLAEGKYDQIEESVLVFGVKNKHGFSIAMDDTKWSYYLMAILKIPVEELNEEFREFDADMAFDANGNIEFWYGYWVPKVKPEWIYELVVDCWHADDDFRNDPITIWKRD